MPAALPEKRKNLAAARFTEHFQRENTPRGIPWSKCNDKGFSRSEQEKRWAASRRKYLSACFVEACLSASHTPAMKRGILGVDTSEGFDRRFSDSCRLMGRQSKRPVDNAPLSTGLYGVGGRGIRGPVTRRGRVPALSRGREPPMAGGRGCPGSPRR